MSALSASDRITDLWYGRGAATVALLPLAWAFQLVSNARRQAYSSGLLGTSRPEAPVIVVGNINVGGTGKTPLVAWLCHYLARHDWRPGIISRGYGGRARHWPQQVRPDSDPVVVGEEAVLLARRCHVPIAVGPERGAAAEGLIEHYGCNIIVSDDGLQHYALERDLEIAVVDGVRRFGNGLLLPAGPLREPVTRLGQADLIVTYGLPARGEFPMKYAGDEFRAVVDRERRVNVRDFQQREVHAVTGIGDPERFFTSLRSRNFRLHRHAYPDHHRFTADQIAFDDDLPVVMTEKDAIKCERFAGKRHWYLPVEAQLPEVFERRLEILLSRIKRG